MKAYEVAIKESSKELTAKEKIRIKDLSNSTNLDALTQEQDSVIIDYDYHVILAIHNEKSKDRPDYENVVVVDKAGNKFNTGSNSFITALEEIIDEMVDAGEENIQIEVYRKPSKNYKGKDFITCSVI